jgi:hypothetical protein
MIRRRKRAGYTLLEIILSLTIAILLLSALYAAVGHQLRQAQAGRDVTNQTTVSRAIVQRIENDVVASLALSDPGRYRKQAKNAQSQQATQSGAQATQTSGKTGQQAAAPEAEAADATSDDAGLGAVSGPVVLPFGVVGDTNSLTLFVSKVPGEIYSTRESDQGQLVSDIRRITYWMADENLGLCRQEVRVATADEALAPGPPSGDVKNFLLAPEVKKMEFRYFDGTGWADSWDSTVPGDDGITPIGAPRAVEVRIGLLPPGGKDGDELKYYRHVILIKTANGITQAGNVAPSTTP